MEKAVLRCTCGTWWTQAAVNEFNDGKIERAMERHLSMWRFDSHPHLFEPHAS